ncbi:hypothetical protein LS633_00360 [Pseudomonas sp. NIBR-H-19]|uniref:hypothetical protein n=2 Tax=Pseudomonas sp. NIBR-H-19 TaxID=2901380 RepID=UPI001E5A48F3|nr:hypothetical protein [Pseudomonas sp. NIBR-H-19]UHC82332.1 hypothetical protein LS633_00360 [Pseudomonas sp. NIBR-H-19]
MSDFSELKKLAEAAQAFPFADEACEFQALSDFYDGCDPAEVLVLIAENEALTKRLEVDPRHSYDGIATRDATIKVLDEQLDQLKAECEGLRKDAPSSEIIWCECGDGYPANSYGAGFMAANEGVCANCDAANQGVEPDLDTLRKDAERYRWLRRAGNTKAIALVAEHCLDALDETIDAALGKGGQS